MEPDGLTFQFSEDFLLAYGGYCQQLREANPGKVFVVQVSVDVIGYGMPEISVVEDVKAVEPEKRALQA